MPSLTCTFSGVIYSETAATPALRKRFSKQAPLCCYSTDLYLLTLPFSDCKTVQQDSKKQKPEDRQTHKEADRKTDRQAQATFESQAKSNKRHRHVNAGLCNKMKHTHTHLEVPVHYVMLVGVRHTV